MTAPTTVLPLMHQPNPRLKSRPRSYRDDRETDSIDGYQKVGKDWASCLLEANKITGRRFQWLLNLNFTTPMPIDLLIERKQRLFRELRRHKHMALFFRIQINEENRSLCHIHFAILDGFTDSLDHLKTVFEKACKPFREEVRVHAEPIKDEQDYIPYINKTRRKDRNKIILWAKGLREFDKVGVKKFPWPQEWNDLPWLSRKNKGSLRERFLKHRRGVARNEIEQIYLRGIFWEFKQYLQDSMGKNKYEVRKLLVSDLAYWENQCEEWIHTPEAKKYFQATKEKMDQAQAGLEAIYKRKTINKAANTAHQRDAEEDLEDPEEPLLGLDAAEDQLKATLVMEEQTAIPQPHSHTDAQDQSSAPIDEAKDPTDEIFQQRLVWNYPIGIGLEALITRFQAPHRESQQSTGPPTTNARPPPIFDVFRAMNLINRNCWRVVGGIEGKCANAVINQKSYGLMTTSAITC